MHGFSTKEQIGWLLEISEPSELHELSMLIKDAIKRGAGNNEMKYIAREIDRVVCQVCLGDGRIGKNLTVACPACKESGWDVWTKSDKAEVA